MEYYEVAPTRIIRSDAATFTYAFSGVLPIGAVVLIEVGRQTMLGVVIKKVRQPNYATKQITSVAEQLPPQLVELALWMSEYYRTPLATVLQTILPRGLDKKRRKQPATILAATRNRTTILFNTDQQHAIDAISKEESGTFLLQGVTGSGKTEVYKELARRTIAAGRSVIILVPEIALTTQTIAEFTHDFPDLIVSHSTMTEAERHLAWLKVRTSPGPQVIIGPRSALFMPLADIGAIIVDEAHEPSYKQEQAPRYSALRAATMLGRFHQTKVVFGSATPLISERYFAEQAGRPVLLLPTLARHKAVPATVSVVDMTKRDQFKQHRFLSDSLITSVESALATGHQALIFHNRRGSAATTLCDNCGWTANCPRCFIPLVLHGDHYQLRCHICDHTRPVPTSCPTCHHANIIHKGIGTKLIESELRKLFPKATIMRFDSDNKDGEAIHQHYQALYDGTIDIAIGTQVVAKGLDLPHLQTVGVIQADSGLMLPDFSSSERTFQLLSQVIGRVGRDDRPTSAIIQTYQATHPAITNGVIQNYQAFYDHTLQERRQAHFPPFTYLLKLTTIYKTEAAAIKSARTLVASLKKSVHPDVTILGPTPAFYERRGDTYRWQLTLKSPKRDHLIAALALIPPTHWQSELDPPSLL